MSKSIDWHSLERNSRLARVMWPNLSAPEDQREMAELSKNENKKSPMQALSGAAIQPRKEMVVKMKIKSGGGLNSRQTSHVREGKQNQAHRAVSPAGCCSTRCCYAVP